jgi:electron transfer flavoprotein-quinone oxidoreductase
LESDFQVIVVGAGPAGSVAAYELAKAGKSVLLIDRGNFAGAKNMTGGRLYVHSLRKVFSGEVLNTAPFERRITHERISLMAKDSNFTVDFSSSAMSVEMQESYSVLRATFDQWLAAQAEKAGAECIFGLTVDRLIKDSSGKVNGVIVGDDEFTSDIVILADGANSLLTADAVGAVRPPASQMAVGVKQVFELPANVFTDRILAQSDTDGAAWLFVGDATHGIFGGGFVYTNKESISLGVVAGIEAIANKGNASIVKMLEDFKAHPGVAPLIKGARLVEHSGHLVPEGGYSLMPEVVGDGVLVAGDAAMMCINLGYMVRGIDLAVASGQMAGQAAVQALDASDTGKAGLGCYRRMLEDSFVMKDLKQYAKGPGFLEGFDRMFGIYPEMIRDSLNAVFIVDGKPAKSLLKKLFPIVRQAGLFKILKDVIIAVRTL